MKKAHEELIAIEFLVSAELVKIRGSGAVYRYLFNHDFQNREIAERKRIVIAQSPDAEISQELLNYGIGRDTVEAMVQESLPQLKLILRHI